MAEEKKPKIDLKARLGKTMVAGAGAAPGATPTPGVVPPPVGSVPPPAIPAPVIPAPVTSRTSVPPPAVASGGIPVPPFAQPAANPFAPKAAPAAPAPPPRAAEIKVEVGTEAVEAAKKNRKFIGIAGVVGALLGVAIGWQFGAGSERGAREKFTISKAGDLAKEVETANVKIKELATKIKAASDSMRTKKFPETFAAELGALNIPFDAANLAGKGVGGYDAKTLDMLFQYTSDVQALNTRKDALKSLFSGQKKAIQETLESGEKPQLRYTLLVINGPKGPVGSLAPIADPFALGGDWPKEYKMQNLISKEVQTVSRYDKGEPFSTKDKRIGIPIEPDSLSAAFPNDISGRVLSELAKTAQVLNGVQAATPDDEEKAGLIKNGDLLVESLKKISAKGKLAAHAQSSEGRAIQSRGLRRFVRRDPPGPSPGKSMVGAGRAERGRRGSGTKRSLRLAGG